MFSNFKKIFNIIFIFGLCILISESSFATELIDLTSDEIAAAGNNGMIAAMCYVYNLMTGTIGRIIMAFFVVGLGWGFITGEIKDYKAIFNFSIAVSLSLGAVQIANLISGNDYSCQTFTDADNLEKNTIYNAGICSISNITEYYPGQAWYACTYSSDNNSCTTSISNETYISDNSNTFVTLYTCQSGYLKKDKAQYIKYECLNSGIFNTLSSDTVVKNASCVKACTQSSLKSIYSTYNFDSSTLTITSGYNEGDYYSQGTKIDLNCKDGYYEYDDNNNIDENAITVSCGDDGVFTISGNCKPKCDLTKTSYYKTVKTWNKCVDNNCTATDETEFFYGDIIEVNVCNTDYILTEDDSFLRLKCGNSGSWEVESEGKQCSKSCNIKDINNYDNSRIGYCPTSGLCSIDMIDEKEIFYPNDEEVGVYYCEEGYGFNYGPTESARYTCQTDGTWKNTNSGYECYKTCTLSELPAYENTTEWKYCDSKTDDNCKILPSSTITVVSDTMLKASTCKTGYSVSPYSPTIFTCNDGKFTTYYDKSGICNITCKMSDLKNVPISSGTSLINNASAVVRSNSNGVIIDDDGIVGYDEVVNINNITDDTYASLDSYYTIYECNSGYSIKDGEKPIIFKCDVSKGWYLYKYKENICEASCSKESLPTDINVLDWEYKDVNGNYIEFSLSNVNSGTIVKPRTCNVGYSISATNTSYYICNNGVFEENSLNGALTIKNVCSNN